MRIAIFIGASHHIEKSATVLIPKGRFRFIVDGLLDTTYTIGEGGPTVTHDFVLTTDEPLKLELIRATEGNESGLFKILIERID